MYEGGSRRGSHSAQLFRLVGLVAPIILVINGALLQLGYIESRHATDYLGVYFFSFWWLYIAIVQYLIKASTKFENILTLVAYHLLTGSYLVFISGTSSGFTAFWIILILASYLYFSKLGAIYSSLALLAFTILDIILWHNVVPTIIINDITTLIAVLISGYIIIYVCKQQQTSRKELEQSRAQESLQRDRVLTIVNNLSDAVISTDMEGIIRVYNAACLNLLDTNVGLNGQHIDKVLPVTDQSNKTISLFSEFKQSKTVTKRDDLDYFFNKDDKIRLEITFSTIHSSYSRSKKTQTHDGYIVIMRDVTKSKSLEEERDEFISVISHELRTPITIAEGTISNVQVMMSHPDATTTMLKDAIKTAHDQVLFLAGMVNDLSTLSRAERGVADEAEDIDVRELAHQLHKKYEVEAKAKKLHLNLDLSAKLTKVHVSRLYLEEMLQNFITNAIKYTKKGGVTIIVKQKDDIITFAIKDTGIGVSKSDQNKIFDKFYRSEDYRTRETGGTGLGLYIAAKLAYKIGTKVQLKSRLNFGSTFSFSLPESK